MHLKNELNILKEQMPTTTSEDDDIVMKAVEERVKQWKVSLPSYSTGINHDEIFRIYSKRKMMKSMILNGES